MPVDARDAAMRTVEPDIIRALVATYHNPTPGYTTALERQGQRAAVRDVAARLGVYERFADAVEGHDTGEPSRADKG